MQKGKSSVIEQLKAEITAQSEGQDEVIEFSFQGIKIDSFTPEIVKLFDKYPKLISLEFNACGLKSLDGFPKLKNLVKLCFDENQLEDNSLQYLVDNYPELQFLSLNQNKFTKIESLKLLAKLPEIVQLDLQGNTVAENSNYRKQLFEDLKKLEILDNKDRDGNEVEYSDEDEDGDDLDDDDDDDEEITDDDGDAIDDDDDEDDEEEDPEPLPRKQAKH